MYAPPAKISQGAERVKAEWLQRGFDAS